MDELNSHFEVNIKRLAEEIKRKLVNDLLSKFNEDTK